VPALLRQVLSMRNQSFPESTGQQGVAGVVGRATEVLAGHTDPASAGLPQHYVVHANPFIHQLNNKCVCTSSAGDFWQATSDGIPTTADQVTS
tara:strand:+ start:389 stop:667 length:279 start_codon:yes stop_codon:yes gene_type:complete